MLIALVEAEVFQSFVFLRERTAHRLKGAATAPRARTFLAATASAASRPVISGPLATVTFPAALLGTRSTAPHVARGCRLVAFSCRGGLAGAGFAAALRPPTTSTPPAATPLSARLRVGIRSLIGFLSTTARGRVQRLAADEIGILDVVITPFGLFVLAPSGRSLARCSGRTVCRWLPVAEVAIASAATSASSSTAATRLAVAPGLLLTTITAAIARRCIAVAVSAGLIPHSGRRILLLEQGLAALLTVDPAAALEIVVRPRQFLGTPFWPPFDTILARP